MDRSGIFSFYGKQFKVEPKENQPSIPPKATINVFISSISGVRVEYKGVVYETELFIKPKKVEDSAPKERKSTVYTPPDTHYYKYGQSLFKRVTFEDSD